MNYGIYISAEGAMAQQTRLEVISNNLANVQTAGFKRDLAIAQSRYAEEVQRGHQIPGMGGIDDLGGGVMTRETVTDFGPGPLNNTGVGSDVAAIGDAFFVVNRDGRNYLTKAGNFQVTSNGTLVTQEGDAVLAEDGENIVIDPNGGPWQYTADGAVLQAGTRRNLALVKPLSFGDLVKQGDNLYHSLTPPVALSPAERKVAPEHLEMSSVKPAYEMLEMITTSRAFEANANLIRTQDQLYGTLLSRVLKA